MKKVIATSVLTSAIILFPTLSQGEELKLPANLGVEQKTEVRKGATENYPIVEYIPPGKSVPVIDQFTDIKGELWYRVDLGNNVLGWSPASRFTEKSVIGKTATVNRDNINVRRGADVSYDSIAKLSNGKLVKIIGSFKNTKAETWYRIEFDKKIGWMIADFAVINSSPNQTEVEPTTKTVQVPVAIVRKGALTSYTEIAWIVQGQEVKVIDTFINSKNEIWYRIDLLWCNC